MAVTNGTFHHCCSINPAPSELWGFFPNVSKTCAPSKNKSKSIKLEANFSHGAHANKVKGTIFSLGIIHTYYREHMHLKKVMILIYFFQFQTKFKPLQSSVACDSIPLTQTTKRMWWTRSLQLNTWSFPASCVTSEVDSTPGSQAAVQWKRHFKVRKSKVTQSSVWLF